MSKRIGIWVRVSPTRDENESPDHHLHRARSYADSRGWSVTEVYMLESVSGKTVHEHPEMDRMLSDIRSGHIEGLIFSSLARLARKKSTLWDVVELFRKKNAALVCLDMNLDTATPSGELLFGILSAVVEWEGQQISERVSASVPVRAKLGKSTGGSAIYGYQWLDGKLVPDPKEAPIRVLIYELYKEHQRLAVVKRILNERGYRTRNGGKWSDSVIQYLLVDTTAKGLRRANYTTRRRSKTKKIYSQLKPESEWVWVPVPAIVDESLWDECNQIYLRQKRTRVSRKAENTFTGMIWCGPCGRSLYADGAPQYRRKYRCPKCRTSIFLSTIDKAFNHRLWEFFGDQTSYDDYASHSKSKMEQQKALLKNLRREKDKLNVDMKRAEKDYLSGDLSAKRFEPIAADIEKRIDAINLESTKIMGTMDALNADILSSEIVSKEISSIPIKWDAFNKKEKREFAKQIVSKMELTGDNLVIDLVYPSSGVIKQIC